MKSLTSPTNEPPSAQALNQKTISANALAESYNKHERALSVRPCCRRYNRQGNYYEMIFFTKAHFIIGIAFFVLFLLTGVYMLFNFPELYSSREEVRMMYRATHIYILMSALTNLMAGSYLLQLTQSTFVKLRKFASLLILVTPVLFFVAFIYEPADYLIERPVSFWGVVFLVGGVIIHTLLNMKWINKNVI